MVQAYNYMIESFQPNKSVKYRANKKSELKKVYNSIVNINKRSPLYKINLSKENQDYAIGVKESAIALKEKVREMADPVKAGFRTKAISVSNDYMISAELLNEDADTFPKDINILVNSLATPQINRGKELFHPSRGLRRGIYEFRAKIKDQTYRLSFTHPERMENRETLKKMAEFLNQSLPYITASVETGDKEDYSRIVITSDITGNNGEPIFSFFDDDIFEDGVVEYFGLNRMEEEPSNANFVLNGVNKQISTNSFSIENTLEIKLLNTGEIPVTLRIVPDKNEILQGVESFLQVYNGLIQIAKSRMEETKEHFGATKLISELKSLENIYHQELEACGFMPTEEGMLLLDDALATQASEDGGMESLFTRENGFIARVLDKAGTITINPMEYLDKTIVTYPNNEKSSYVNPYITSMYSGLFFNSYC